MEGIKRRLGLAWPKYLAAEIAACGETLSAKNAFLSYGFYLAALLVCARLFDLRPLFIGVLALMGIFFVPQVILGYVEHRYQLHRFSDVTQYMEQMLYSFRENKKILKSWMEMEPLFADRPIGAAIGRAKERLIYGESEESAFRALQEIEKDYPCEKLHLMHQFLLHVETIGGTFTDSVELLQEDRARWVERVLELEKERTRKKNHVFLSIIASILLCVVMERLLPAQVDTRGFVLTQVVTTVMLVLDMLLYVWAQSMVRVDWLCPKENITESEVDAYLDYVETYDPVMALAHALPGLFVPTLLCMSAMFLKIPMLYVSAAVTVPVVLGRPHLRYVNYKKALRRQMQTRFSHWLMEVALTVQTNTVRNAIRSTFPSAPAVLKPQLSRLIAGFDADPTSIQPYLEFGKEYALPQMQATMKMLYAISRGTGLDPAGQIREIIDRSNTLLDKEKRQDNEEKMAGLYAMFLVPQLISGGKILVDMCLFFVLFFQYIHA